MIGEVVLLKLSNGIDVIGKLVTEDVYTLVFHKLRMLHYQAIGNETRIGFAPFLIASEDLDMVLFKSHILARLVAPSKIAEGYRQATSPIQLANTIPNDIRGKVIEVKPN